jgi:hypothetical protein
LFPCEGISQGIMNLAIPILEGWGRQQRLLRVSSGL